MISIPELVANHPLLSGLPEDILGPLSGCAKNVAIVRGELLITEGQPADFFYLIRRGHLSVETFAPGSGPIVIETLSPGQIAGWSWLFPPYRWQFDVRATEPVGAIAVDAGCLRSKVEQDPAVGYELMLRFGAVMLERLQATRFRLLDLYGRAGRGQP